MSREHFPFINRILLADICSLGRLDKGMILCASSLQDVQTGVLQSLVTTRYLNLVAPILLAYFYTVRSLEIKGPVVNAEHITPLTDVRSLLFDAGLRKDWMVFKRTAADVRHQGLDEHELVMTTAIMTRMIRFPDVMHVLSYKDVTSYLLFQVSQQDPPPGAGSLIYHGKEFRYVTDVCPRSMMTDTDDLIKAQQPNQVAYSYFRSHRQGDTIVILVNCYIKHGEIFFHAIMDQILCTLCAIPEGVEIQRVSPAHLQDRIKFRMIISPDPGQRFITSGILTPQEGRCSWIELASDYFLGTAYAEVFLLSQAMRRIDRNAL